MRPSELLMQRFQGEEVVPKRLALQPASIAMARELIALFQAMAGDSREALNTQLQVLEGEDTDYRVKRGLAHALCTSFCTFEVRSPLDPAMLRQRVFASSAQTVPSPQTSTHTLSQLAGALSREL